MDEKKLGTKIFSKADDITRSQWYQLFPPIVESYDFFRTLDQTTTEQFKNYYITIYENDQMVCIAPCFLMDYPLETTIEGPLRKIIEKIKKIFPRFLSIRALICGASACEGRIGLKSDQPATIIKELIHAMFLLAQSQKASLIAFKDFPRASQSCLAPIASFAFHEVQAYPAAELTIHFKSFDEYFSSLSRATRKDLKRKFAKVADVAITMETRNALGDELDAAYALYTNTLGKSDVQFEIMPKTFFQNISINMPDEAKYFLWRIDGKLVAFNLCLVKNGILVDAYIGLDYAIAHQYHLYYLTFRDIVIWCIENKISVYEAGALNYDPKKRLDFKFIPQYIYARHVNPVLNFFFGAICTIIKPENYDPIFKALKANEKNHAPDA